MKSKLIHALSALIKIASIFVGLAAYVSMIPPDYMPGALVAFMVASSVKDVATTIGDWIDDGIRNNSFGGVKTLLLCGLAISLCSCTTSITGERQFIGLTSAEWLTEGRGVVLREAPVVFNNVRTIRARTSAKNPVIVQ